MNQWQNSKRADELSSGDIISLSGQRIRVSTVISHDMRTIISGNVSQFGPDLYIESVPSYRLFVIRNLEEK